MRLDLPDGMGDIWRSGDYVGDQRPIARITLQQARIEITEYDYANAQTAVDSTLPQKNEVAVAVVPSGTGNPIYGVMGEVGGQPNTTTVAIQTNTDSASPVPTPTTVHQQYASIIFGSTEVPKELPNVKSVAWSRADSQDFATATIIFYNTKPLPIGVAPSRDLDQPGYYTYNRGMTSFANRWGQTPNEWSNLLLPDNLLRTYEGYGCNPYVVPELDEHLMQTGMWLIDKVAYGADGLITVTVRDVGRVLADQIIFPPVIPKDFYPLSFGATNEQTGLIGPKTFTYSVDTGGKHDPNHVPPEWQTIPGPYGSPGPYNPPTQVSVTVEGDRTATVRWRHPDFNEYPGSDGSWTNGGPGNATQIQANITADQDNITAADVAFSVAAALPHSNPTQVAIRDAALLAAHNQKADAESQLASDQAALWTAEHIFAYSPTKGFVIVGYQLVLDGVRLPEMIPPGPFNDRSTWLTYDIPSELLRNGMVYTVHMVAIWREDFTPQGEIFFQTNVELSEVSDFSDGTIAIRPAISLGPDITPFVGGTDIVPLGPWAIGTTYHVHDVVSHDGLLWEALLLNTGVAPSNTPAQLSHAGWTFAASPAGTPGNVIDGNTATYWTTTANQSPTAGQSFTIDLGSAQHFDSLAMVTGDFNYGMYPRGLDIAVSNDGSTWATVSSTTPGPGDATNVSFGDQNARYVRLTQTGLATTVWRIGELALFSMRPLSDWQQLPTVRGPFDPTISYIPGDTVTFNGYTWIALTNTVVGSAPFYQTTPPNDATAWLQLGGIELNVDDTSALLPGAVAFGYDDKGSDATWKLLAYRDIDATGLPADRKTYSIATKPGSDRAYFTTGDDLGDMTQWNYVVYGMLDLTQIWHPIDQAGYLAGKNFSATWTGIYPPESVDLTQVVGVGDVFYRTNGQPAEFFAAPIAGAPPHDPGPAPTAPSISTRTTVTAVTTASSAQITNPVAGSGGTTTRRTPLVKNRTSLDFDDSSNTYYVGRDGAVFGHTPEMAFDANEASYWLSISNLRNDAGYAYEWMQGKLDNITLDQVEFTTAKTNYGVYVSVFAKGTWVHWDSGDVIPYNPALPESHNGGNIPFVEKLNTGDDEGPHTVTFRHPIPGATKVRLTFHNLPDFSIGTYPYRAGLRDFKAYAQSGGDTETINTPARTTTTTVDTSTVSYDETISKTVTPAPVVVGPPQDDDSPEIARTYQDTTPAHIVPGAGTTPGTYSDYTDIVKLFCAWGGFFWPEHATLTISDGSQVQYNFGTAEYGLENVDPVLGAEGSGRVWGDFEQTGTAGPSLIPVENWDKKSLMDGINFVREIIGFLFYIDEQGGVVWRQPNVFQIGNWVGNYGKDSGRTSSMVTIDERQTLIGLTATVDSANVRERVFVATVDGTIGALAKGWNPNPIGLRRVAGWTDQHFGSAAECQVMADLIALRQLFTYRTDHITIPGYPCIQVDDQVRILEQTTSEGFIHYVSGIASNLDMESGQWTYDLDTHWLGEDPLNLWVFQPENLAVETQAYLDALKIPAGAALPEGTI